MRILICALACLPLPLVADTLTISSKATSAVVYAQGALVTHDITVTLPAGSHQLVLPNLPRGTALDGLRVAAPGLKLGALRYRDDLTPPQPDADTPEITAAKSAITRIEDRIQSVQDTAARQMLAVEAATARVAFLSQLGQSDTLPRDAETLRGLGQMIGEDTLIARQAAFDAEIAVRETRKQLKDLNKELAEAKQALAALIPTPNDRPLLVMDVIAAAPVTDAPVAVSFYADAFWQPTYDLRLSDAPEPKLIVERGAQVMQQTGENWDGIALTVSSLTPTNQTDPNTLRPDLRQISDGRKFGASVAPAPARRALDLAEGVRTQAAPVALEDSSASVRTNFQGLSVSYVYSDPVDVATGADAVRLPFDSLTLDAELVARAVPLNHDTAFLIAKITNTTGEPLLQSDAVLRFFDGVLVGTSFLGTIEAGQEAEIGFGAIDGLQLTRRLLKRDAGDRGIITRSNEQTEEIEITVNNLTDRTWNLELRDRVPYSEQEDLEITYRASPEPDVTGVDDKRGVLQWNQTIRPGAESKINTSHRITWPEGMDLR